MENSRIEGIGHQLKGAVKESLGKAIGDAKLAADGTAERTIGDAQNAADTGGDQVFGIDTERVKGIGHQLKGALIQGIGSLVGNPKLQADGVAEQLAGKAQNAAPRGTWNARLARTGMRQSIPARKPIRSMTGRGLSRGTAGTGHHFASARNDRPQPFDMQFKNEPLEDR